MVIVAVAVLVIMIVAVSVSTARVRVRVIAVPVPAVRFGHARPFAARAQNSRRTRRRSVKALSRPPQGPGVSTDVDPDPSRDPDATAETAAGSDPDSHHPVDPESTAGAGTGNGTGTDGGYVHAPGGPTGAGDATRRAEPEPTGFGAAGWLLTAAVVVCFLLVPGVIYLYPYVLGATGLGFLGTYLALPLLPAVLLGLIAVWSMTAAR